MSTQRHVAGPMRAVTTARSPRFSSTLFPTGKFSLQSLASSCRLSRQTSPHDKRSPQLSCSATLAAPYFTGSSLAAAASGFFSVGSVGGTVLGSLETVDLLAAGATLLASLFWVHVFDELARRNILEQKLCRKLLHISVGLLFVLTWPLFSSSPTAPLLAAVIPAANGVRLLLLGLGVFRDEAAVRSISRSGSSSELLRGPLFYTMVITAVTCVFWRNSPIGLVAVASMCAGDGLADIVGRRFGHLKLPWNSRKSWAGSIAMSVGGFIASVGVIWFLSLSGCQDCTHTSALALGIICLATAVVESLPITDQLDDNLAVPVTAIVLGCILL